MNFLFLFWGGGGRRGEGVTSSPFNDVMNFSVRTGGTQEDWHLVRKEKITYYAIGLRYLVPFYSAEYVGNRPADIANK